MIQYVWDFQLHTLRVTGRSFLNHGKFLSMKAVFILANSADLDEMQHNAAFHLGIHFLSKYPYRGFQFTKGWPGNNEITNGHRREKTCFQGLWQGNAQSSLLSYIY